jgi:hypothetical protein
MSSQLRQDSPTYNRFLLQMGLLIQTSFDTAQGVSVSTPYCRIISVTYDKLGGGEYTVTLRLDTYISRDASQSGKQPISTPGIPSYLSYRGVFGDMASVYGLLKNDLHSRGILTEDVLEPPPEPTPEVSQQSSESTQPTLPTPPPPEEPPASTQEPQPQPSSEYAPTPAETEA